MPALFDTFQFDTTQFDATSSAPATPGSWTVSLVPQNWTAVINIGSAPLESSIGVK